MTTELFFLVLTSILASSLWLPFIVGVNTTSFEGQSDSFTRPPDPRNMKPWIHRAFRAHQNLLEQFMPYAAIVLTGHALGVSTAITEWCAILFFILRLAHAVGMITALARFPLRPVIFTAGWVISMIHAWQVLAHAPSAAIAN
jgi:uncharacterized MAPEG superfamily protein